MTVCSFRAARETDRQAFLALAEDAGSEPDDANALWDSWMADQACEVTIGEMDGEPVAIGNVVALGAREGWLELQHIDSGHRQQGLTLALTAYQIDLAQKSELRLLRWAVSSGNAAAQRVASKLGFHRVAVWGSFVAEHFGLGAPELTPLDERHYSQVQNWLGKSPIFRTTGSLFEQGGRWQELTGKAMHAILAAGQAVGLISEDGRLTAFAILSRDCGTLPRGASPSHCQSGYVDGEWGSLERLALALRGHGAKDSREQTRVMLPGEPTVRGIFQAAGYREESDGRDLWIYERLLV